MSEMTWKTFVLRIFFIISIFIAGFILGAHNMETSIDNAMFELMAGCEDVGDILYVTGNEETGYLSYRCYYYDFENETQARRTPCLDQIYRKYNLTSDNPDNIQVSTLISYNQSGLHIIPRMMATMSNTSLEAFTDYLKCEGFE